MTQGITKVGMNMRWRCCCFYFVAYFENPRKRLSLELHRHRSSLMFNSWISLRKFSWLGISLVLKAVTRFEMSRRDLTRWHLPRISMNIAFFFRRSMNIGLCQFVFNRQSWCLPLQVPCTAASSREPYEIWFNLICFNFVFFLLWEWISGGSKLRDIVWSCQISAPHIQSLKDM